MYKSHIYTKISPHISFKGIKPRIINYIKSKICRHICFEILMRNIKQNKEQNLPIREYMNANSN